MFELTPIHNGLSAEIGSIDLNQPLAKDTLGALHQVWMDYPVLRFRDQSLSDDAFLDFSGQLGPLDHAPVGLVKPGQDRSVLPKVTVISNIVEDGKPIGGLGSAEAEWHTDISYTEKPAMASALYAIEIPTSGGETHFCNMYAAYERLPQALRAQVTGMRIKHDATHNSVGELRSGYEEVGDPRQVAGAIHPIIRTHPESGRRTLFLGRRYMAYVPELSIEESEELLDTLWSYAACEEDCWSQRWAVGDVVLWDNRAVMHRRAGFDPNQRRLMHRTQLIGDAPFE